MADDPTPSNPVAPSQGDPAPATPPTNPPPTDPTPPPSGDPEPSDVDGLKRALAAERATAQTHARDAKAKERRIAELEAADKARADAEKSDLQKAQEERDALKAEKADFQTRIRKQAVSHAAEIAARDAGFADPADVTRFLDLESIEFDDQDRPQGVAEAVKKLATEKPYLVKANGNGGPPATPRSDRPTGAMTADEKANADHVFASHTRSRF